MALEEIVADLAEIAPRDCAAAQRLVSVRPPNAEPVSGSTSEDSPGMMNAQQTEAQARLASDIRSQRAEIIAHRQEMIRRLGRDVSLDEAARDWIPRHAEAWRSENGAGSRENASFS